MNKAQGTTPHSSSDELHKTMLHMALLAWKHGDITMIELKRLISQEAARLAGQVIGSDEESPDYDDDRKHYKDIRYADRDLLLERNELRAQQRQRLSELLDQANLSD